MATCASKLGITDLFIIRKIGKIAFPANGGILTPDLQNFLSFPRRREGGFTFEVQQLL